MEFRCFRPAALVASGWAFAAGALAWTAALYHQPGMLAAALAGWAGWCGWPGWFGLPRRRAWTSGGGLFLSGGRLMVQVLRIPAAAPCRLWVLPLPGLRMVGGRLLVLQPAGGKRVLVPPLTAADADRLCRTLGFAP